MDRKMGTEIQKYAATYDSTDCYRLGDDEKQDSFKNPVFYCPNFLEKAS
jgi:hypothetical protein